MKQNRTKVERADRKKARTDVAGARHGASRAAAPLSPGRPERLARARRSCPHSYLRGQNSNLSSPIDRRPVLAVRSIVFGARHSLGSLRIASGCRWAACRPRTRSPRRCAPSSTPSCGARSSTSAWCARSRSGEGGKVEVVVSLTTPGCPIRSHFQQAVAANVGRARRRDRGRRRLRRAHRRGEGPPAAGARPPGGLPEGALAAGQERDLHRLGQGRRRQVDDDRQPRRRAAGRGPRRAGALDADVYGYSIPRMLGVDQRPEVNAERKILPPDRPGRRSR